MHAAMHDAVADRADARVALAQPPQDLDQRLRMRRRPPARGTARDADPVDLAAERCRRTVGLEQRVLDRRRAGVERQQLIVQT
jgi:hypothetical protein